MGILNETQISTDIVVTECDTGKTSLPVITQCLCEHDLTRLNGLTIFGILVMVLGQNNTAQKFTVPVHSSKLLPESYFLFGMETFGMVN